MLNPVPFQKIFANYRFNNKLFKQKLFWRLQGLKSDYRDLNFEYEISVIINFHFLFDKKNSVVIQRRVRKGVESA
ncbi:MAG: hypothetical protein A3C43_01515 [Candidatus Schekmanbacteria bacterium RIFCSPHIGHO2_02_FULL_38_11]|uniref:Uncharacterized protein n=1 Tax=Candidatus Schekmanbacteria bacterium RIFCSPLOWO2_12_FULL_38_15 TaxID=1817883 RepID=A0A1F7SK70_9BACT|nr:MAG: hypothetical protein A2043_10030 [Candidatus Schekmanbacteria bacterium GWA2_38_9]OGL48291.1 MAG: hypothetical protein A3H37_00025 [Candidatus Schekmanbacteria bacterium RIFCSPLOWO2_02_FULL_38_14]OGL49937.1 MAG: hypothetical protein A3C43_01515 [Candidatus Schekmanbacteria bacterium RIFCSPHIGHO2_02_FULL_38_11]OGL54155.1 MAG: hypothetical protein A3G31_05165 [Candidatus Schekmanbacteria bacterium RIFCSPLOWO2_12_FULL_38_15]